MRSTLLALCSVASMFLVGASPAHAQQSWDVNLSAAYMDFDLSGTGQTGGVAVGAISIKSMPLLKARRKASPSAMTPSGCLRPKRSPHW